MVSFVFFVLRPVFWVEYWVLSIGGGKPTNLTKNPHNG